MASSDLGSQLLRNLLTQGSVLYFIEDSHEEGSPPHYFVVLNDPQPGDPYLMVCATSKGSTVRRITKYYPNTTVIEVTPAEYPEFTADPSYFNCNNVIARSFQTLETKLSRRRLSFKKPISKAIVDKLIEGVLESDVVKNQHKNMLKKK